MSTRETALAALATALVAAVAVVPPAVAPPVLRNEPIPQRVPPQGLLILLDGETQQETPILSPLRFQIEHAAELVVIMPGATAAARTSAMDALLVKISAGLVGARTLSGAVEFCTPGAATFDAVDFDGAAAMRSALVPINLTFTAPGSALA